MVLAALSGFLADAGPEDTYTNSRGPDGSREEGRVQEPTAVRGWFTENRGQPGNRDVRFVYAGQGCQLGFTRSGYLLTMSGGDDRSHTVKVVFEGSSPVTPRGRDLCSHRSNYFLGNDPSGWRTGIPNYGRIVYEDLYKGIDLVFYTREQGVKYDFLVSAGVDPGIINISYQGAEDVVIGPRGRLHIVTPGGELVEEAPRSYQTKDGERVQVPCRFELDEGRLGFELGDYDPSSELVIDPLIYSGFVGGADVDGAYEIAVDPENNIYVSGNTSSTDFPATPGSADETQNGGVDAFVFKMNPEGTELIYASYIGGGGADFGWSIALDSENNVYLGGGTHSSNFPTTPGCYDDTYDGVYGDAFVTKLNQDGSELVYSSYVGGRSYEYSRDIAVDTGNNAYITGYSTSPDFPTTNGCYDDSHNGIDDVIVFKMNQDGSDLVYSTFVGGMESEGGYGITVDTAGNAYVTGCSDSSNFPTTQGCFDDTQNGERDVIVFKLDQDGSELVYSTYIGGSDQDRAYEIVLDPGKNAYITGYTSSANFPTSQGCFDDSHNGGNDILVCRLSQDGSELLYSTFVGSDDEDRAWGLALDDGNDPWVVGDTESASFPTTPDCVDDSHNGGRDIVVFKLDQDGSDLLYSSYIGGGGRDGGGGDIDGGEGIALDDTGKVYVAGGTESTDFPTTAGCFDDSHNGNADVFVFKLGLEETSGERPVAVIDSISPNPAQPGEDVFFSGSGQGTNVVVRYAWRSSCDGEFYNGTNASFQYSRLSAGTHTIYFRVQDDGDAWSDEVTATLVIQESGKGDDDDKGFLPGFLLNAVIAGMVVAATGRRKRGAVQRMKLSRRLNDRFDLVFRRESVVFVDPRSF